MGGRAWAVGVVGSIVVVLLSAVGPRVLPARLRRPTPGWTLFGLWVAVSVWTVFSVYVAHRMAGIEKPPLNTWALCLWKAEGGHSGFWGQGEMAGTLEIDAVLLFILMVVTAVFFLLRRLVRQRGVGGRPAEEARRG